MGKQWKPWDTSFWGSKITADCYCSREIKRLLGRKAMTNIHIMIKSKDSTLSTKVHIAKAMAFPVVMYGCESWSKKKVEHQRIEAFKLWCWRRLLWIPWTARRSNQSVVKEISPEYSFRKNWCWSWNSNTLAIDAKKWLIGKDPDAGKNWRQEEKGTTKDEVVDGITDSMDMSLNRFQKLVMKRKAWCAAVHGVAKRWAWLNDWTELIECRIKRASSLRIWNSSAGRSSPLLVLFGVMLLKIALTSHSRMSGCRSHTCRSHHCGYLGH